MARREPMTADEAAENVASMKAETPRDAQERLIRMALGPIGNLSDAARKIYEARLQELRA